MGSVFLSFHDPLIWVAMPLSSFAKTLPVIFSSPTDFEPFSAPSYTVVNVYMTSTSPFSDTFTLSKFMLNFMLAMASSTGLAACTSLILIPVIISSHN